MQVFFNHMKKDQAVQGVTDLLRFVTQVIAILLCCILIGASAMITVQAFSHLSQNNPQAAILDALFVAILLELFFVVRSFINRGSMNVGAIVNVGIIAAVKELIFQLNSLTWQLALAFGVIFLSLGFLYVVEIIHYEKKR